MRLACLNLEKFLVVGSLLIVLLCADLKVHGRCAKLACGSSQHVTTVPPVDLKKFNRVDDIQNFKALKCMVMALYLR